MESFKKTIGNYVIQLTRQIITIKTLEGELIKGIDVTGSNAMVTFNKVVKAAEAKVTTV